MLRSISWSHENQAYIQKNANLVILSFIIDPFEKISQTQPEASLSRLSKQVSNYINVVKLYLECNELVSFSSVEMTFLNNVSAS